MPYKVEPLDRLDLDDTLRDYVCSICWGPLKFVYEDGQWFALCAEHDEETTGYTSKMFAERKRTESESELIEAERNLRSLMGLTRERQPIEKNLSDLGF